MLTASNVQPDVNAASFLTALHSYLTILVENPQDEEIKCEKKKKKTLTMSGNHFQKTPAMAEKAYECQVHLNTFEYKEKVQSFLQISSVKKVKLIF